MEVDDCKTDNMTILRNEMITHLVNNSEIIFKSQQIGDPELTGDEKRIIAEECLCKKPLNFLSRFSQYMEIPHFDYFKRIHPEYGYEINHYLKENASRKSEITVKNRRLEALKRLALEGDYFTEDEMKKRNPLLYQHLVGKYLTEEEKKDKDSFCHSMNKEEGMKLSSLLLEQYERDIASDLKKEQEDAEEEIETDSEDEYVFDIEGSDPALKEKDDRVLHLWGESKIEANYIVDKQISEGEKRLLFEEFRSHMYRNFIGGKESDFDYSKVDSNTDYDDLDEIDRDEQDKYFSSETPEDVEMKIAVNSEQGNAVLKGGGATAENDNGSVEEVESNPSDPLDAFMYQLKDEQVQQDLNMKMKNAII